MSNISDILTSLVKSEVDKQRFYTEIATVVSIDEDNMNAEVSFISSNANKIVRLGATISEDLSALTSSSVVILPEIDSNVLVTFINETTGFISSITDASKVLYKVGTNRYIQIDENFIEIDGSTDFMVRYLSLNTAMQTFITDLNAKLVTAFTGVGGSWPGTSLDISSAKIDEIKTS
jgi:hypothetical protein